MKIDHVDVKKIYKKKHMREQHNVQIKLLRIYRNTIGKFMIY